MPTLLIRLSGPLQAWGTSSRYVHRQTDQHPSKSGIIGLLAAAQGRRRTDNIEDLAQLRVGVRIDQPGRLERDFQTARSADGKRSMPLSYRYYMADAVYVAGIESDSAEQLEEIAEALRSPQFALFLGRRSCPPDRPVLIGVVNLPLLEALTEAPWEATKTYLRKLKTEHKKLDVIYDAQDQESAGYVRDHPVSFDPAHRQYQLRAVQRHEVLAHNPHYVPSRGNKATVPPSHEPLEGLL
ncbi:type I-E CRISPR-associated protein Cas5/CasD [Jonesia quinghaiensis]|uniref:type I-E CRISPR-associated protein Cas5/CasD n=1 Tax=Jonesia quinghaiensis TaxID=262806 RepID=UPI00042069D2|nr:type I-E CRISPR-associated protein Cas5/CasD [Jonesia quinghaiensis]